MFKHYYLLLYVFASIFFTCCDKKKNSDVTADQVELRVSNVSDYDMENVFINSNGVEHLFGTIKKGEATSYVGFDSIYGTAEVILQINGDTIGYDPLDYIGKPAFSMGKFTYEISVLDLAGKKMAIKFVDDQ